MLENARTDAVDPGRRRACRIVPTAALCWALALLLPEVALAGDAMKTALRQAESPDPATRTKACRQIEIADPSHAGLVPEMVRLLERNRPETKAWALGGWEVAHAVLRGLRRIGPGAAKAVPALRDLVNSTHPTTACLAAEALGGIGEAAREALPTLIAAIPANDGAIRAVGRIGKGSVKAAQELGKVLVEPAPPSVRRRFGDVDGTDAERALRAVRALEKLGPVGRIATPNLVASLGREYLPQPLKRAGPPPPADYRLEAAALLAGYTPRPIAPLRKALDSGNRNARMFSAVALGLMGDEAAEAVPSLTANLSHDDADVRRRCAEALGRVGAGARQATPDLAARLTDQKHEVRTAAAVALGAIGPSDARAARAVVLGLRREELGRVRQSYERVAGAVVRFGKTAVPFLKEALHFDYEEGKTVMQRKMMADLLCRIGEPAVATLVGGVESEDMTTRSSSVSALKRLGAVAAPAAPALVEILRCHGETDNVEEVFETLEAIGKAAIPELDGFVEGREKKGYDHLKVRALKALERLKEAPGK